MKLESNFVENLTPVHPRDFAAQLQSGNRPSFDTYWCLENQIKPVDLYCYLYGRFGKPNGIQNFLRGDHSENLVHWEWALQACGRIILMQGHNFRTELWLSGNPLTKDALDQLVAEIKSQFQEYGAAMSKVRRSLEQWIEFINPYQRIKGSIERLTAELQELDIQNQASPIDGLSQGDDPEEWSKIWTEQGKLISKATGLCFGIRSMLPVMAEAFVNLLLYLLMKPSLKADDRLRESIIRQPIDIRVKSLSNNCSGFKRDIDYSSESCRRYHSLVNERNDLLHGNVVIDKLKFNELYFNGKVPVFKHYASMWDRAFGVAKQSVGLDRLHQEQKDVESFIDYVISCLDDNLQEQVCLLCAKRELGLCLDDGQLVDMVPGSKSRPVMDAPNKSLQPTAIPLRGLPAAELRRSAGV